MNWNYPRNKLITIRVNEDLFNKAKKIIEEKEKNHWHKTNMADLLEEKLKEYISKESK